MKFALWLENDWNQFVSKHFDEPDNEGTLLVFADWLEEHGESGFAEAIRVILQGYHVQGKTDLPSAPTFDQRWINKASELLIPIYDRLKGKVKFPTETWIRNGGYTFTIKRTKYTVVDDGIVKTGSFDRINPKRWTQELVEAAVFVILRGLISKIPQRHRDDNRETKRPSSFYERQLQGRLHQLIKDVNHLNATLQMRQANGFGTERDLQIINNDIQDLSVQAQYFVHMIPTAETKGANPENLRDEITQLLGLLPELYRRAHAMDINITSNLRMLQGDLTYWQLHSRSNED